MNWRTLATIAAWLVLAACQHKRYNLEGRVEEAPTGRPIASPVILYRLVPPFLPLPMMMSTLDEVASMKATANGEFAFNGLKPGTYSVVSVASLTGTAVKIPKDSRIVLKCLAPCSIDPVEWSKRGVFPKD